MVQGTIAERRYLSSQSFALFFTYYFFDYVKYHYADFHYEMFADVHDLMDNQIRELTWMMFRESAKTSLAKGLVMWLIAHGLAKYINVDSFDRENSERILFDTVVEMQQNEKLKFDFGELFNWKRDPDEATQKRVNNFITNTGVRVEAHSISESVRGRIHAHQRPDFLLLDDFETNKTKESKAYLLQVLRHIDEFKGGLDPFAKVLYLCNYITEYGAVQALIDRSKTDPKLRVRNVPVVYGPGINWNTLTLFEGSSLAWPDKYVITDKEAEATGRVSLQDKRAFLGSQTFQAEMMNQPIDELTQEIFKAWFKFRKLEDVQKMVTRKFATIDTALSKADDDDFTAITKNYVDLDGRWNISTQRYRINSKQLVDIIFQLHDQNFEKIGIEETAYLGAIKPFFDLECQKRNKYPYVVALKHGGVQKETRIRGVIGRWEIGDLYLIDGLCDDLMDEALRFPKSPHDDCLDSLQYQNQIAQKPYPVEKESDYEEEKPIYSDIGL